MKIKYLYILILTINSHIIFGQVFDNSQSHSNIKWKQIQGEKFDLIFPEEFSNQAPKLAQQLDVFLEQMNTGFNRPLRKIPFVIQQNHLTPNGFVMLAPRKSELYPTPSGIADNQEWLPNLALHESRHVIQFDNLTGKIQGAFFQQLALALFALHLPSWYFEGDATFQETLFSAGGRGRLASWNMPIRANILSDRNYNFNKYVHGSFKDIVPSYYTIGYFMSSELYEIDSLIHPKILEEMNGKLLRPFNFQKALKKYSGTNSKQLFTKTMRNLAEEWTVDSVLLTTTYDPTDRYPSDYLLPQVANNKLYVLKENRQRTPVIVAMATDKNSKQRRIVEVGRQIMPYFHVQGHLIVWDEYRRDPRFQKQTYNIINVYDLNTKRTRALTNKTRYYTPILSPDLQTIACIEANLENNTSLVLLDTYSGEIKETIPMPRGLHIQQPQYHSSGGKIIAIAVHQKGTNLIEINTLTHEIKELLDWSNFQYERPIYDGDDIVFKANYSDKDEIYKWANGHLLKLTKSSFGAFNPSISNDTLWYNDYDIDGYKLRQQAKTIVQQDTFKWDAAQTLYPSQNKFRFDTTAIQHSNYTIKKYNVTAHSFNFHSLTLSGNDFESFDNLKPGIFWLSNDILNTTQAKIGYEYDTEIRKSTYSANITYQRYFPRLSISYNNRGQIGQATRNDDSTVDFDWREHYLAADIQLPFTIYRRHYTYSYGVNMGTSFLKRYDVSLSGLQNFHTTLNFPLNYQVYLNRNRTMSMMDLTPRWGQNFSFTYRHLPFDQNQTGSTWSLRTNFYFPGILLNHGLQVRYAVQEKSGRYTHNNDIPLPHGFSFYPTAVLKNTLLFNYRLPLAYPDWSIGSLAYIKRIRADLAADYQNLQGADIAPKTMGMGISMDLNLFKYPLPIFALTGRMTYINDVNAKQQYVPTFSFSYTY